MSPCRQSLSVNKQAHISFSSCLQALAEPELRAGQARQAEYLQIQWVRESKDLALVFAC